MSEEIIDLIADVYRNIDLRKDKTIIFVETFNRYILIEKTSDIILLTLYREQITNWNREEITKVVEENLMEHVENLFENLVFDETIVRFFEFEEAFIYGEYITTNYGTERILHLVEIK